MNGPSPVKGPAAEASTTQRDAQPISLPARKWNAGSVAQVIENAEPDKANGLSEAVDMLKRLPPVTSAAPRKKRAAAIGTLVDKVGSAVPAPMS